MTNRKSGIMRIDYAYKFNSMQEAEKEANRIAEHIKRKAEQKAYAVTLLIGISENDGRKGEFKMIERQTPGRREKRFVPNNSDENGEVKPHLHIMFQACPCHTIADLISSCINNRMRKLALDGKATKHGCDTKYARYIKKQSKKIRMVDCDNDNVLNDEIKTMFRTLKKTSSGNEFRERAIKKTEKPLYTNEKSNFVEPVCNSLFTASFREPPAVTGGEFPTVLNGETCGEEGMGEGRERNGLEIEIRVRQNTVTVIKMDGVEKEFSLTINNLS